MEQMLLISNILLWLLVIGLSVAVLLLARQVGVLHERITPVGALMIGKGLRVGETSPNFRLANLNGPEVTIGGARADGRGTLLFFLSPTCPVCASLLPTLLTLVKQEDLALVLASDGTVEEHTSFIARKGLADLPYVLSTELGVRFGVSKLPYAALIDSDGVLRAHGLVNNREHLESLIEAEQEGVASIQDFVKRESAK
ncbi:methylamine dehydrogenase accessory protein MauD [Parvibaculum sedimenti]|uniref:Methylamine utilization protein MauD n=2 Tax=Parvibaculum sedimenti TaxID=2608632 RepID=A0A6N6VMB2_9HYPH|nr:methylamine dehydrogenase accessory protein MauD [Parvibaculum sedimenti]